MTPLYIEIALHYFCSAVEFPRIEAPACQAAVDDLVQRGLLRDRGSAYRPRYQSTDALQVYVQALRSVPFPVQKWVIEEHRRCAFRERSDCAVHANHRTSAILSDCA